MLAATEILRDDAERVLSTEEQSSAAKQFEVNEARRFAPGERERLRTLGRMIETEANQ